ncbi:MAG: ribosomal-processing cysteine protease Prp [Clostridiales bacterium]|nr:ribosomal-processing cysteine protease Prp [Clostridiales bacterium]
MTTITVYGTAQGEVRGFEASGHAGSAQSRRNDLVCCAVSVLTQTCVNALEAVAGVVPEVVLRDGYLRCLLPEGVSGETMAAAQIIFRTALQGLTDIEKTNPKRIRVQQQEWRQADAYDESSALRA